MRRTRTDRLLDGDRANVDAVRSGESSGVEQRPDRGFTFIEIVVTISLLGIVVLSLLVATRTSVTVSSTTRTVANVESAMLNAADRIERAPRPDCDLSKFVEAAALTEFALPAGSDLSAIVQVDQQHLAGAAWQDGACPSSGFQPGLLQRVTFTLTSPAGSVSRTMQVVKGDI